MNGRTASKRYRQFAPKYVSLGFNGAQTVLNLGWTDNPASAKVIAHRLLTNVNCRKLVEYHIMKAKLSADEVLEELSEIAKTKTEIDGNQRLKALELLGKGHKLFVDRTEQLITNSSSESAILKSIQLAASKDGMSQENAAIQLFHALRDDPQFCDLSSWPAEYRAVIQSHLTASTEVIESSTEQ